MIFENMVDSQTGARCTDFQKLENSWKAHFSQGYIINCTGYQMEYLEKNELWKVTLFHKGIFPEPEVVGVLVPMELYKKVSSN